MVQYSLMSYLPILEEMMTRIPKWERVNIEAWDGHPTYRIGKKNFLFASKDGRSLGLKLGKEEALAVVGSDPEVEPMGYGLGRHGWVSVNLKKKPTKARWVEIEEWLRTSYTLVAPKKLASEVLEADGLL